MMAASDGKAKASPLRSGRAQAVVGTLTVIYGSYRLIRLLLGFGAGLSEPRPPFLGEGELDWLLTLGMPWPLWIRVGYTAAGASAVGMIAAGFALILVKRRWLCVALIALLPGLVLDALLIPAHIAIILGRVSLSRIVTGSTESTEPSQHHIAWLEGIGIALTALFTVYFFWLWSQVKRMRAGGGTAETQSPADPVQGGTTTA